MLDKIFIFDLSAALTPEKRNRGRLSGVRKRDNARKHLRCTSVPRATRGVTNQLITSIYARTCTCFHARIPRAKVPAVQFARIHTECIDNPVRFLPFDTHDRT